jgi:hypothetical protein
MGSTQSKLISDESLSDIDMPSPPTMSRQVSVAGSDNVTATDDETDPLQSVYTKYFHTVVSKMDMSKELPTPVHGTPMDSTIILDETGSMTKMGLEAVQSVSGYLEGQQASGFDVNVTIIRFNEYFRFTPSLNVHDPRLEITDYNPLGATALFDAIVFGILNATSPQNVVIVTDGENNTSVIKLHELNTLIQRAEACGWTFTYVGCTLEAFEQGTKLTMTNAPIYTDGCGIENEGAPPPPSLFRALSSTSDRVSAMNRELVS